MLKRLNVITLNDYTGTEIEKSFKEHHQHELEKGFIKHGLMRRVITDKTGKKTTVWVKTNKVKENLRLNKPHNIITENEDDKLYETAVQSVYDRRAGEDSVDQKVKDWDDFKDMYADEIETEYKEYLRDHIADLNNE